MKIEIEQVEGWQGLDLGDYARDEAKATGKFAPARRMWVLRLEGKPMLIGGLTPTSMLGSGAEVWIMLCRDSTVQMRHYIGFLYRAVRRLTRLYGGLRAAVRDDFWAGHRFAKFFGFVETGQTVSLDGAVYIVYEVRRWRWP